MTTLTTPEAQKFLAEQLKDKIIIAKKDSDGFDGFFWRTIPSPHEANEDEPHEILDTEWDYIARLVEGKLTEVQKREYVFKLFSQFSEDDDWDAASTRLVFFPMVSADYVQRATALKQTMGKE